MPLLLPVLLLLQRLHPARAHQPPWLLVRLLLLHRRWQALRLRPSKLPVLLLLQRLHPAQVQRPLQLLGWQPGRRLHWAQAWTWLRLQGLLPQAQRKQRRWRMERLPSSSQLLLLLLARRLCLVQVRTWLLALLALAPPPRRQRGWSTGLHQIRWQLLVLLLLQLF